MEQITREEFCAAIERLCAANRLSALPKRARDREIVLKSIALRFRGDEQYGEATVDDELIAWLREVRARGPGLDHAELRRALVDHGYLGRSRDGRRYWLQPGPQAFAAAIDEVDVLAVIAAARNELAARKARYEDASRRSAGGGVESRA